MPAFLNAQPRDLGAARSFIGLNIKHTHDGWTIYQTAFIKQLASSKYMIVSNQNRPDISFAAAYLARFAEFPSKVLYNDCIRVVRYLSSPTTAELCLFYLRSSIAKSIRRRLERLEYQRYKAYKLIDNS